MPKQSNRFLIIPGFAKAGTTYLFDQLSTRPDLFNLPNTKELGAFRVRYERDKYLALFKTHDPQRTYLDASPNYVEPWYHALRNVAETLADDDVHLLFCLRSPIERAFSHYAHDIRGAFWQFGFDASRFEDPRVLSRYLYRQLPRIQIAADLFGRDRLHGFTIDLDGVGLDAGLLDFLGLPSDWRPSNRGERFSGGWLPRVFYSASRAEIVESGGLLYELPPRCLLVSSGRHSLIHSDLPPEIGERFLRTAASWTRTFDPATLGDALERIEEDYRISRITLGLPEPPPVDLAPLSLTDPPPLPDAVAQMLRPIGRLSDGLDRTHSFGAGAVPAQLQKPLVCVHQEVTNLFLAMYNASSSESAALTSQLIDRLHIALEAHGPIPPWLNNFVIKCIVCRQTGRAHKFLTDHPYAMPLLDKPRILEILERCRPSMPNEEIYFMMKGLFSCSE